MGDDYRYLTNGYSMFFHLNITLYNHTTTNHYRIEYKNTFNILFK